MTLQGYAAVKAIVSKVSSLANWYDQNKPSNARITLSQSDYDTLNKNKDSGRAFGVSYGDAMRYKRFELARLQA